jgi:hypothetical protein
MLCAQSSVATDVSQHAAGDRARPPGRCRRGCAGGTNRCVQCHRDQPAIPPCWQHLGEALQARWWRACVYNVRLGVRTAHMHCISERELAPMAAQRHFTPPPHTAARAAVSAHTLHKPRPHTMRGTAKHTAKRIRSLAAAVQKLPVSRVTHHSAPSSHTAVVTDSKRCLAGTMDDSCSTVYHPCHARLCRQCHTQPHSERHEMQSRLSKDMRSRLTLPPACLTQARTTTVIGPAAALLLCTASVGGTAQAAAGRRQML